MNPLRALLLAGSESAWLSRQAQRRAFVRQAVARFMPGETVDEALAAVAALREHRLAALLTCLGENVRDATEARAVVRHYRDVADRIRDLGLDAELSVKLTQLGLDLSTAEAIENMACVAEGARALPGRLWIDMESSGYVDRTLEVLNAVRQRHPRLGVCIQAYLHRSAEDVEALVGQGTPVRLVKGAYREPPSVAMPRKRDVDESFFRLAARILKPDARHARTWLVVATHDPAIIARVAAHAEQAGVPRDGFEFAMLYGIRPAEQRRLAAAGYRCRVLVSYGAGWFPWYMRRLAERPANLMFVLRSMLRG